MSEKKPDFSVIVLFGRGELEPCLSSLLRQTEESFEIIGVVNQEVPKVNDPRVKFLVIPEQNPARRRNLGVAESRGKYLAFIDDDAIAPEDWLSRARKILEEKPEIAGLGGTNIAPEQMTWREQLTDMLLSDPYFGSGSKSYLKKGKARPARPGEVHLSNFFLRREIFEAVKGFNEKIGYGGEDSELVYWVKKKTSKEFWFFPELFVIHQRRPFGWEWLKRNFRFRRKNGKMLWLYPEMYLWNITLWAGLALIGLCFALLFLIPISFFLLATVFAYYFGFFFHSLFRTLQRKKYLCFIAPFIYFIHHLTYFLGLSVGLIEGMLRGRKRLRELYGRENKAQG